MQEVECIALWNIAAGLLIDGFESDMSMLKSDIYDICNGDSQYIGLKRLNCLDDIRKHQYLSMEFTTCLSLDFGEPTDSKFFASTLPESDNIIQSV